MSPSHRPPCHAALPRSRRTRSRGFTLIELVTVITIVAIGVALAVPSFRELILRSTTTAIGNDLVAAFAQARAEAVKRGVYVAVVATSGSDDWSSGWSVLADADRDGTFNAQVAAHDAIAGSYVVRASGGAQAGRVVFGVQGELIGATQVDVNVCRADRDVARSKLIQVRASGIVVTRRDTSASTAPSC